MRALALIVPLFGLAGCSGSSDAEPAGCDLPTVSAQACAAAHEMQLPAALLPARGNQYADNESAARLGYRLFFDANIGSGLSCATCHAPELAFTDRRSVSLGKIVGTRNSPTVLNAARLSVFFWDGRADSLWSQPLFALENPAEIGSDRLTIAHFIAKKYLSEYEAIFGPMPDVQAWPMAGKPGDAAFDGLPSAMQAEVNRVFVNVSKAFEAYLRKNTTGAAPLDGFLKGDANRIIGAAQRGLNAFLNHQCQACHGGPMLTDERFHDAGFPSLPGAAPDPGRSRGLALLKASPFNLAGPYADAGPGIPASVPAEATEPAAFRTPSLRNITRTFPYGHDGALATLPDVLAVHAPGLTEAERGDLLAFFETLQGDYPPLPWSTWPTPQ